MDSTNLLQHQMNKFGVVTVMDVLLLDLVTNQPVLLLDTLKITSIAQEGEQKEIRGGIGAPELISYDFARTITLEIQDALASMSSLQMLWGGKALDGDVEYTAMFEAKAGENGAIAVPEGITLAKSLGEGGALVIDPKQMIVLGVDTDKVYVPTAATDTALTTGATEGEIVRVFLPATETIAEGAMALAINSVNMPPTVKMVGQTFFIDQNTGAEIPMQIEIPRLKINIGGGLTMEAEGDAAVFDFAGKALADKNKNFFILKQLKGLSVKE